MPERSDTKEDNICEPEQLRWKRLPRKGTTSSLNLRSDRDATQQLESAKRPKVSRFQHSIVVSQSDLPSNHTETEDERYDDDERVVRSRALALRQGSTNSATLYERHNPPPNSRRGVRPKMLHPEDHKMLYLLNNSPFVLLGSGGGDPFLTLPSNLPKAFLDEHLQTSKYPKASTCVARMRISVFIVNRHWIC